MATEAALALLDRQVTLLRWLQTERGRTAIGDYLLSQMERKTPFTRVYSDTPIELISAEYCRKIAQDLDRSETYWVTSDMTQLIEAAYSGLAQTPLAIHELPVPRGFCEFARPLGVPQTVEHVDEPEMWPRFDAVSWAQEPHVQVVSVDGDSEPRPGMLLTYWETIQHAAEDTVKWEVNEDWPLRDVVDNIQVALGRTPYIPVHVTAWAFDTPWDPERTGQLRPGWEIDRGGVMQRQVLRALWLMLKQELPAVRRVKPPRGQARRLGRNLKDVPEVVVVDLRRRQSRQDEAAEPGDEAVAWSHRWVVNSFWRNQWYPSEQVHRPIWIAPYVKGPEDKPLVVKDRVYRLVR